MFAISTDPIETSALMARVEDPTCGAVVVFEGRVRNHHRGRDVLRLEYESYRPLAELEGNRIVAHAIEKFGLRAGACIHRTGVLEIGEIAVVVAVTSAHRDAAFDACRYIIDELKATVPIWKREWYADGTQEWTGCDACAGHAHTHSH